MKNTMILVSKNPTIFQWIKDIEIVYYHNIIEAKSIHEALGLIDFSDCRVIAVDLDSFGREEGITFFKEIYTNYSEIFRISCSSKYLFKNSYSEEYHNKKFIRDLKYNPEMNKNFNGKLFEFYKAYIIGSFRDKSYDLYTVQIDDPAIETDPYKQHTDFPATQNILFHWNKTGKEGKLQLNIPQKKMKIDIKWSEYQMKNNKEYIASFHINDKPFEISEIYNKTQYSNKTSYIYNTQYKSKKGTNCTKLIEALLNKFNLKIRKSKNKKYKDFFEINILDDSIEIKNNDKKINSEDFNLYIMPEKYQAVIKRKNYEDSDQ